MIGRPQPSEAAPHHLSRYIDRCEGDNPIEMLDSQSAASIAMLRQISEEHSLYRYAPDKWTVREVLNHVNDTERAFAYRALWFARGFTTPLESLEQEPCVRTAQANLSSWASLIEEFQAVRSATLALFRNLPNDAWTRAGVAGGNHITVRALAFLAVGHADHHFEIVRNRYLKQVAGR